LNPSFYIDIETGATVESLPVVGRVVWVLHGILRKQPGLFAVAFPRLKKGEGRHPGNLVRVFSDSAEKLKQVLQSLQENERVQQYVSYYKPKPVPEDFDGAWVEYRRYRIPNTRSRLDKCREYRLNAAEAVPFIRATSKTNGQAFSLHIDAVPGVKPDTCVPDSYGLSVVTRTFALPMVE
jgi:hypothetical protein